MVYDIFLDNGKKQTASNEKSDCFGQWLYIVMGGQYTVIV